jgi:acetolactate synthase-1/2/3 large subunit
MASDNRTGETTMARMTGGRALVEKLSQHGIDTLFALPGVQNDALFSALYDVGGRIRVVHTRHEQGAGYMAFGYAKSTGKVGAYAVVPGPGVLNTTAALATAFAASARVLCITGQIPSAMIGRGFGLLHEVPDQLAILRGLTKWAERIGHPTDVPRAMDEAFRQLAAGRPRPVAVEMPMDAMALETEVNLGNAGAIDGALPLDAEAVDKAAALLGSAERPMIVVGSGVEDAGEALLAVAEALEAPVVALQNGKGVVSDRHYLAHSGPAGNRLWADADAVLAVGTRLLLPLTQWGVDDGLKIVRIDVDPAEIQRFRPPTLGLVAEAGAALTALADALGRHNRKRASRKDELQRLKAEMAAKFADTVGPQVEYLKAIRAALPDDGFFVDELTQVGYVSRFAFPNYRPRRYITSGYQGTLGYGFAAALGVKVAHPDAAVVSVAGDGGFMFNVQELATAVQHGIGVAVVVFNDGAFGNVLRMQKDLYGGRVIATNLKNPDFVKLAETFGAAGVRAASPKELGAALTQAFARPGPTLIEVPIGEVPQPWPFIQLPRVRPKKS